MASGTAAASAGMVEALREGLRALGWLGGRSIVATLARPGENVADLSRSLDFDIGGRRLQLLEEAIPAARRIAVLEPPQFPEARAVEEFDGVFVAMARQHPQALLVVSDWLFDSHATRLAARATRSRLPSVHGARSNVHEGRPMFHGPNLVHQLGPAAAYVDRTLDVAVPSSFLLRVDRIIE